jgi:hypothetical protein
MRSVLLAERHRPLPIMYLCALISESQGKRAKFFEFLNLLAERHSPRPATAFREPLQYRPFRCARFRRTPGRNSRRCFTAAFASAAIPTAIRYAATTVALRLWPSAQ